MMARGLLVLALESPGLRNNLTIGKETAAAAAELLLLRPQ